MAKLVLAVVLVVGGVTGAVALSAGTDRHGATVRHFKVKSRYVGGRSLDQIGVVPGGAAPSGRRPLLVFLHGRGLHPEALLSDEFFSGLAEIGFYDREDTVMVSSVFAEDENAHEVSRYQLATMTNYVSKYEK